MEVVVVVVLLNIPVTDYGGEFKQTTIVSSKYFALKADFGCKYVIMM